MLETLRHMTKSWIMKTILGLLALTFVVFFGSSNFGGGHGGGHSGRNTNAVVEVGHLDYTLNQVAREFNVLAAQISQSSGQTINLASPLAGTVLDQALHTMITRSLYDVAARDLGISASDSAVENAIRQLPVFRGEDGRFDRQLFRGYLHQSGLSEAAFINGAREDLKRDQYLGTLRETITVPEAMLDALYKYRAERRVVELVTVSAAIVEG
ncbi:MAG: SurA N-terminal domain-containing protein, partial [Alphaproteobacteria bacterium]|nr:SurA N-terminal domain-containing protein [Alphaproteobacteria bacterium]